MPDAERKLRLKIESDTAKAKAGVVSLKGTLTELNSAVSLVKQGGEILQGVWDATGGKALELGNQIDDLQRSTGMTAEETSKLITVFGTLGIDTALLTKAAVSLRKDGLAPDLETLANLSDEFVALHTPVEKNTFLFEHFGKAGQEMGELMEKGGEKIRAMADEAGRLGVVMSEEDVQAAVELQIELRKLEILSSKYATTLGTKAVPALSKFAQAQLDAAEVTRVMKKAQEDGLITYQEAELTMNLYGIGLRTLYGNIRDKVYAEEASEKATRAAAQASTDAVPAVESNAAAYDALKKAIDGASGATEDMTYNQYMEMAAEMILAGQPELAEKYVTLAREAKAHDDNIKLIIDDLEKLDGKTAHVYIVEHYSRQNAYPGPYQPWTPPGGNPVTAQNETNRAAGGTFVVPPGYPRDSYRVGVQSGEKVKVTSAGKVSDSDAAVVAEMHSIRNDIRRMTRQLPTAIRDAVERV
jgi:hypothetical protein